MSRKKKETRKRRIIASPSFWKAAIEQQQGTSRARRRGTPVSQRCTQHTSHPVNQGEEKKKSVLKRRRPSSSSSVAAMPRGNLLLSSLLLCCGGGGGLKRAPLQYIQGVKAQNLAVDVVSQSGLAYVRSGEKGGKQG